MTSMIMMMKVGLQNSLITDVLDSIWGQSARCLGGQN